MNFNEKQFRVLVEKTEKTIVALGTTSISVLRRHQKFTEQLVEYLTSMGVPFERDACLLWVDSVKHDSAAAKNTSYVDWIAFRRFVILLAEQEAGTLDSWKHYQSKKLEMPASENFLDILFLYQAYLFDCGLVAQTISAYTAYSRRLLIFLEDQGISKVSDIQHKDIAGYFVSQRFSNRSPRGIQTESSCHKNFILFLAENGHTGCKSLHYAIPHYHVSVERIITILTPEMELDILEDETDSLVNKRDKAVCLLALHIGLRSCDIRNLKFGDIDWEKGILTIRQQKTDVFLQMPLDNETQNAIIEYVLNERRDCKSEYIFVTALGPAQKMARRHFRIKYRTQNSASFEKIPHDGLHIFRRTYASRLLQCGTPLPMISEMLGHIGKDSVQCYLSTDEVKMKRCALDLSLIPYRRRDF